MKATTFLSRAAAGLVAAVAGFASYQHIYDVATGAGEHTSVASVLPLAIDGLILVATLAMLDDKRNGRRPRMSARVALVFGVLATLAANIASANPTLTARLVAAVPAVSFLLAVEVLARVGKPARTELATAELPSPPADLVPLASENLERLFSELPAGPDTPPAEVTVPARPPAPRVRPKTLTSADKVARAVAKMPDGTPEQIAAKAGVSERTARRYMPAKTSATVPAPSAPDAAETATVPPVNGQPVDLAEVTR